MILVLGGTGRLGSALVDAGPALGITVVPAGSSDVDVTNVGQVAQAIEQHQPQAVVNAAAYTAVDRAERQVWRALAVNGDGAQVVAQACQRAGVRCLQVSTDYVLGGGPGPLDEDTPRRPLQVYGTTKATGERLALEAGALVVRVSWLYRAGWGGFLDQALAAMELGQPVQVVDAFEGAPCPVDLVAPWLLQAALGGPVGLFHLGTTGVGTHQEWLQLAATDLGLPWTGRLVAPEAVGMLAPRPRRSELASERFRRAWGYRPLSWQAALLDDLDRVRQSTPSYPPTPDRRS